jgi:hypothetical protein
MRGQWISNWSARLETLSRLRLGGRFASLPDYAGATVGAGWRKLKGIARVRLIDGTVHTAEVHWYEAHGIGQKELKIKFPLLDSL